VICLCWWRREDSNSGPPPDVVPSRGRAGALTCGSLAVVTARARCTPMSAGPRVLTVYRRAPSRPVADASGPPVLRDQGSDSPAGHGKAYPS